TRTRRPAMPSSRGSRASVTARDHSISVVQRRADEPGREPARHARVHWPNGGSHVALSIAPITRPFDAVVELPGSKSYSNRALLVAALAARFLTAAVALARGTFVIDGSPAMRKRPIQPLLDGLRALGVDTESREGTGCPPVVVRARGIAGGHARVRGDVSSQYLSALLMAAPYAARDVEIEIEGDLVPAPYVPRTLSTMEEFG